MPDPCSADLDSQHAADLMSVQDFGHRDLDRLAGLELPLEISSTLTP
jgi:hypothetical protein